MPKTIQKITVDPARCKGCRLCVINCPKGVLAMSSALSARGINAAEVVGGAVCVGCLNCAVVCPEAAIEISVEPGGGEKADPRAAAAR